MCPLLPGCPPRPPRSRARGQAQTDSNGRFIGKSPPPRRKLAPLPPTKQQQKQQTAATSAMTPGVAPAPGSMPWRNGDTAMAAAAPGVHGRTGPPPLSVQGQYDGLAAPPASPYGKSLENGGSAGFGGSSGFSGSGANGRATRAGLPPDSIPPPSSTHDQNNRLQQASFGSQGPDASNGGGGAAASAAGAGAGAPPFHDHNALSAAAPEILTQMGYRRAPAFGPEGVWSGCGAGAGAARGQAAAPAVAPAAPPVMRMDAPPVLVLQPGWGVTLPPYFLGMMDPKRPRNVPVKVGALDAYCTCVSWSPSEGAPLSPRVLHTHRLLRLVKKGAVGSDVQKKALALSPLSPFRANRTFLPSESNVGPRASKNGTGTAGSLPRAPRSPSYSHRRRRQTVLSATS